MASPTQISTWAVPALCLGREDYVNHGVEAVRVWGGVESGESEGGGDGGRQVPMCLATYGL